MIMHEVKVHPSKALLKREDQLAWKIAGVATDKVAVQKDVQEMIINRIIDNASVAIAAIAVIATLTSLAMQERNVLREKVAELTPRAARVMDHKNAWREAAPAVDPDTWPQQMLLQHQLLV